MGLLLWCRRGTHRKTLLPMKTMRRARISKENSPVRKRATEEGFRSGLEYENALLLREWGVPFQYEPVSGKIHYEQPAKQRVYTPDFVLGNGVIIEVKGIFSPEDRMKHKLIKKQHPELDIRFILQNPRQKLSKGSKTTLSQWCRQNGFQCAEKKIPKSWTKEDNILKPKCKSM